MTMADIMKKKLTDAFSPESLDIVDESESHRGHSGFREGGETHFAIEIVSDAFDGQTKIARQRSVYVVLGEELKERIHALRMRTETPKERLRRENS